MEATCSVLTLQFCRVKAVCEGKRGVRRKVGCEKKKNGEQERFEGAETSLSESKEGARRKRGCEGKVGCRRERCGRDYSVGSIQFCRVKAGCQNGKEVREGKVGWRREKRGNCEKEKSGCEGKRGCAKEKVGARREKGGAKGF